MLSFTLKPTHTTTTILLHSPFLSSPLPNSHHPPNKLLRFRPHPISALIIPSSSSPSNSAKQSKVYQPFRAPTTESPIPPQFRKLDIPARLDVLTNRLGLWYEYAPLIPPLIREGFTPPTIEEITGISGVEQNLLVVAAQVRESMVQEDVAPEILEYFDKGGAELLYELRLLNADQREAAAKYLIETRFDASGAEELARAIKDFPRRRGDRGWDSFDYTLPADCLAYVYYRQALEYKDDNLRNPFLEKALSVAVSDVAKAWVLKELEGNDEGGEGGGGRLVDGMKVPVVRLNLGEIAEATIITVLPVIGGKEMKSGIDEVPWECGCKGAFGIVEAEKGWSKWVVLPAWNPVAGLSSGGGVAVSFSDARALPWRVNKWYRDEPILVVVDRSRKEVAFDDCFYLVESEDENKDGELKVKRGITLKEDGVIESLGSVVIVVRPPRDDMEREISAIEWD